MLRNYFKVVLRHYRKHKLYAGLNLLGLVIAYTAVFLIAVYLLHETSYESFHTQKNQIYRLSHHDYADGGFESHWARTHLDYINDLPEAIPEIEHLIRFQSHQRRYIRVGQQKFRAPHTYVTDPEVFEVFDFKLLQGDPTEALKAPFSIVLTETIARKYFGDSNPIGQEVAVVGDYTTDEVLHTVTGVMQDLPAHTHLPVDILLSYQNEQERSWWAYIYILLKDGVEGSIVQQKLPAFIADHMDENSNRRIEIILQPLEDIHLHSHLAREIVPNGDIFYIRIFAFVGIFILLIALINYLNLSSALAITRSQEVGMRFVLGAEPKSLIGMALLESVLYNLLAASLSLGLSATLLPFFLALVEIPSILSVWNLVASLLG
ncbi:MAG: ABC transporter permease, partial [Bacteroidota bacterium]